MAIQQTGLELISSIVIALVMIPISALILMIVTKLFKLENSRYGTAIKITAILAAISILFLIVGYFLPALSFLPLVSLALVSIVLAIWLIKSFYILSIGKSILIWLIWFIFSFVVNIVVGLIIGLIFAIISGVAMLATA